MTAQLSFGCDRGMASAAPGGGRVEHPRLVLATTILASSLAFIDGSVLNVALPAIGRSFDAATAEVQWVINAFLLPLSALLLIGGAAGDLYGRRRLLIGGILLFAAASLLCAAAPSLPLFLAGRALQGLGAAMLLPNSLAILSAAFSGEQRGRAVGTWAAAGAAAGAIAPLIGGWLVDSVGWPAIFLINLPVAAAAIWLGWRYVPESRQGSRTKPDWPGALGATLALGALTWGLTVWTAGNGMEATILPSLAGGLMLAFLFLFIERRRGAQAMVPLDLFGSRPFVGLTILTFLLYGALGGLLVLLPYTLIEAAGYAAVTAGSALLPFPIVIAAASPLMGKLAARIGPRWPLTIGPLVVAAGFGLGLRIGIDSDYWTTVLPSILAISVGMAIAVAPLTTAVLSAVDEGHVGTASGLNSAVSRTGGLIATALLGAVLARQGQGLIDGYHQASLVGAALAVATSLCAFLTLGGLDRKAGA
ncbi:MFS transporter [Sphingosinicella sp. CPCC 101087]|uniref:MFS transporter n=1 Tax=Sphingosinicella sp. CPCC 101087 TaxID=2497754 RepID=UPI001FB086BF|nr:MFS transporter [Sphingosinicella sp. CPCC 101087]